MTYSYGTATILVFCLTIVNANVLINMSLANNCTLNQGAFYCTVPGNSTLLFNEPALGTFNVTSSVVYSGTSRTSYGRCISTSCTPYTQWCGCANSVGSSSCSIGNYYTLRRGPAFYFNISSALFCTLGRQTYYCSDTNWLPSAPYMCLDIANTYTLNISYPNFPTMDDPTVSLLNYTVNPINGTLASNGTSLYRVSGNIKLFAADFIFSSPDISAQLPDGSGCDNTNVVNFYTPQSGQICQNVSFTRIIPTTNTSFVQWTFRPFDNWFYQRMNIYGNIVTLAVCKDLCIVLNLQGSTLVGPGFLQYGQISPNGYYDCEASNCFTPNCCANPVDPLLPNPCAISQTGTINCLTQVVTYNYTLNNWTSVNPNIEFYCDVDTGACFKPLNSDYHWNTLSIILVCCLSLILFLFLVFLFIFGCKAFQNYQSM